MKSTFRYVAAIFLSAFLMFWVQPMVGKRLLPLLGGTPGVWNTCLLFFQVLLLAGYLYAHALQKVHSRWGGLIHLLFAVASLLFLPPTLRSMTIPTNEIPVWWLLEVLLFFVGLPFFILATSAPLIQSWFSTTGRDPYFLYAASNLGSFLGLFSYPLVVERNLKLETQMQVWSYGFVVYLFLLATCWKPKDAVKRTHSEVTPWRSVAVWCGLSFVPSSWMIGVTTYVSTNVAPVPLLWIVPLSLYLLTFVIVFSRAKQRWPFQKLFSPLVLILTVVMVTNVDDVPWALVAFHLIVFFVASLVMHQELVSQRPAPEKLTLYYLCMSIGGAAGGVFNSLVSPVLFNGLYEYAITIVVACFLRPKEKELRKPKDLLLWAGWLLGTTILVWCVQLLKVSPTPTIVLLMLGVPAILCYQFSRKPLLFGGAIACLFIAREIYKPPQETLLTRSRNFFGSIAVNWDPRRDFHDFVHGDTVHGRQSLKPESANDPLMYFHRRGPLGSVFSLRETFVLRKVAVLGLGIGAMAAYARPNEEWTFYEIDPAVASIARDPRYFTFLTKSHAKNLEIVLGDGRLRMNHAEPSSFDLIILDAFSSDSVPLHLLTKEAVAVYSSKLNKNGILVANISNRFVNLREPLAAVARANGLTSYFARAAEPADDTGYCPSRWMVMTARKENLGNLLSDSRWGEVISDKDQSIFTDDFSNVFDLLSRKN